MTPPPRRRSSDGTELESTVPYADVTDAMDSKLDRILVILEGHHDSNGEHYPGLSHRVKRLETYLNAALGISLTLVTGIILAFVVSHMGWK